MTEKLHIKTTSNIHNHLVTILEWIVYILVIGSMLIIFLLMLVSYVIMDNIHDCYNYLFKKRLVTRPPLLSTTICRLLRTGTWKLKKKWYGRKSHLN